MAVAMSGASRSLIEQTRNALARAHFNPQHAGDVFLRADAETALREALPDAVITVSSHDTVRLPTGRFLGYSYRPDLMVELAQTRLAVIVTLVRTGAGPISALLARALVISEQFPVVAVIVDRRIDRAEPFGGRRQQRQGRGRTDERILDYLYRKNQVAIAIVRQQPFSFG